MKRYYFLLLVSGMLITACSEITSTAELTEGKKDIVMQDDYYTSSLVYNQTAYSIDLPYAEPIDSVISKPVVINADIANLKLKEVSDKAWSYIINSKQNADGIVTIAYRMHYSFRFNEVAVPVFFLLDKAEIDGNNLPSVIPEVEILPPEVKFCGEVTDREQGTLTKKYLLTCSIRLTSNGVSAVSSTTQELLDVYDEIKISPDVDPWQGIDVK